MKRIYLIIIVFIFSLSLNAQLYRDYNARAGLTESKKIADASIENSILIGIGAINFSKLAEEAPFDLSFNKNTGSSKLWVYFFANSQNENQTTQVPLINTLAGYFDLRSLIGDFDFDEVDFPHIELNPNFMDSDEFISNLMMNMDYMNFLSKYSSSDFSFVGISSVDLGDDSDYESSWAISYTDENDEDTFTCFSNASTKETNCVESTHMSIKFTLNEEIKVYPQPANDELIVNTNNKYSNFKIIDLIGNEIKINSQNLLNGNLLNLDISKLNTGMYFIILENENKNDVVRFIKQ